MGQKERGNLKKVVPRVQPPCPPVIHPVFKRVDVKRRLLLCSRGHLVDAGCLSSPASTDFECGVGEGAGSGVQRTLEGGTERELGAITRRRL
ncbi:hypothetical protein SCLCIDRAFT_919832 [Scleroderma citrinum Foug A]|uniref:Uncharacterized protein n=1 Tax=Scleroderma citrinum Foug A TaxID=1036808 RepID=A0A0C2ZH83_9AGAM|nr:hypothetical protein SCLCIDRAFT_919832 [Scleroderma citrinum Foug A]